MNNENSLVKKVKEIDTNKYYSDEDVFDRLIDIIEILADKTEELENATKLNIFSIREQGKKIIDLSKETYKINKKIKNVV